jgi:hypothetical protein
MFEDDKRDFAGLQVLLVTDVFVGRDDEFIFEFFPPMCPRLLDGMIREKPGKTARRSVVEKDFHPRS